MIPLLTRAARPAWHTLLDAPVLRPEDPDRHAIVYLETDRDPIVVSRAEFRAQAIRHAAALGALGAGPRDLVIIAHTQDLESIYAFWGALLAGAIPSMFPTLTDKLDPTLYMDSMAELTRLSDVRAILTTDSFAESLRNRVECAVIGSSELTRATAGADVVSFSPASPAPSETAFLQHSSGTTGLQKGVALSHDAVLNQVAAYAEALALREDDVLVSWLPLYHDMGLIAGFVMPLLQGIPLVLMSPFDWVSHPAMLFRAIHEYRGTLCWLPNFAYNHLARRVRERDVEGLRLDSMRMFVNCSEPVYPASHRLFAERFAANGIRPEMLQVSYAMAENTFAVTQTPPGRAPRVDVIDRVALQERSRAELVPPDHPHADERASCGPPIPGTEVRAVDADGRPLSERHAGQLAVRSDCMLAEYYRRPDLDPFVDGWFLTGDTGYVADGEVYVVGRMKDLIINGGKNVYPQDLEAIVNTVPGVHPGRAVVFGVPDEREGTELVAVVAEVDTADEAAKREVAAGIRQAVVRGSTVTATFVHLVGAGWLIKTSSGKIARGVNREKWLRERR